MRSTLIVFLLFLLAKTYGQVEFQPGYIINSEGQKISCQIKNIDWLSNPDKIEYRLPEGSEVVEGAAANILEFQVAGFPRYAAASVDIDFSSPDFAHLSFERNPVWERKTVFL